MEHGGGEAADDQEAVAAQVHTTFLATALARAAGGSVAVWGPEERLKSDLRSRPGAAGTRARAHTHSTRSHLSIQTFINASLGLAMAMNQCIYKIK